MLTFDGPPLTSGVTAPAGPDAPAESSLATITGTAADSLVNLSSADVTAVYLSLQNDLGNAPGDPNAGKYWNPIANAWVDGVIWSTTSWDGSNWTFNSAALDNNLKLDSLYILISSAVDKAGNVQAPLPASGDPGYRVKKYQPLPAGSGPPPPPPPTHYK